MITCLAMFQKAVSPWEPAARIQIAPLNNLSVSLKFALTLVTGLVTRTSIAKSSWTFLPGAPAWLAFKIWTMMVCVIPTARSSPAMTMPPAITSWESLSVRVMWATRETVLIAKTPMPAWVSLVPKALTALTWQRRMWALPAVIARPGKR